MSRITTSSRPTMPDFQAAGPRPHSTAAGVRGGRSVFSSVNTAWTCCSDQSIRLFISTCCSSAAAPPARTRTRYGTGGAGGLPDFHRFTRYRRLPQQVATHRAAHLPLQRQRAWRYPVCWRSWLSCQRRASRALVSASLCACRCGQTQSSTDSAEAPIPAAGSIPGARPAAAPPSFPRRIQQPCLTIAPVTLAARHTAGHLKRGPPAGDKRHSGEGPGLMRRYVRARRLAMRQIPIVRASVTSRMSHAPSEGTGKNSRHTSALSRRPTAPAHAAARGSFHLPR